MWRELRLVLLEGYFVSAELNFFFYLFIVSRGGPVRLILYKSLFWYKIQCLTTGPSPLLLDRSTTSLVSKSIEGL